MNQETTNEALHEALYPEHAASPNGKKLPDYPSIHKELANPGVNLTLLWNANVNE